MELFDHHTCMEKENILIVYFCVVQHQYLEPRVEKMEKHG